MLSLVMGIAKLDTAEKHKFDFLFSQKQQASG